MAQRKISILIEAISKNLDAQFKAIAQSIGLLDRATGGAAASLSRVERSVVALTKIGQGDFLRGVETAQDDVARSAQSLAERLSRQEITTGQAAKGFGVLADRLSLARQAIIETGIGLAGFTTSLDADIEGLRKFETELRAVGNRAVQTSTAIEQRGFFGQLVSRMFAPYHVLRMFAVGVPGGFTAAFQTIEQLEKVAEKVGRQDVVASVKGMNDSFAAMSQALVQMNFHGTNVLDWIVRAAEGAKGLAGFFVLAAGQAGIMAATLEAAVVQGIARIEMMLGMLSEAQFQAIQVKSFAGIEAQQASATQALAAFLAGPQDVGKAGDELARTLSEIMKQQGDFFKSLYENVQIPHEAIQQLIFQFTELTQSFARGKITRQELLEGLREIDRAGRVLAQSAAIASQGLENMLGVAERADQAAAGLKSQLGQLDKAYAASAEAVKAGLVESLTKLDEKFRESAVKAAEDFQQKLLGIEQAAAEKSEDTERNHSDRLVKIEESYQRAVRSVADRYEKARLRALIDRDARALFEAEQSREEGMKDAERSRDEARRDEARDYAERLREADDYRRRQIEAARRAFEQQQQDARTAYERERADLIYQAQDRLSALAQQYATERGLLQQQLDQQRAILNAAMISLENTYRFHYQQQESDLIQHLIEMNRIQSLLGTGGAFSSIGSQTRLNELPRRQRGGIIPGPPTQPFPMIAHGGEAVVPADLVPALRQFLGGGMRVTVAFSGGGAAGALLEQLMKETAYQAIVEVVS